MSNVTCPVCSGKGIVFINSNGSGPFQECPTRNGFCLVPSADASLAAWNPAVNVFDGSDNVATDGVDVNPPQDG